MTTNWRYLAGAFALLLCLTMVSAQTTTETRSGTVVYVSGNDLVVKGDDGQVKHFTVPDSTVFHVDGKDVSVHDLKVGTHLSQTITTTSTPRTVTTVITIKGKVWNVNGPYVILTLPDGTNKQYKVPDGTKFKIDGEEKTVFDLRPGMNVEATVVRETPEVIVSRNSSVTGSAPAVAKASPPPPRMPATISVLLIEEAPAPPPRKAAAPPPATTAAVTPPPAPVAAAPEPKPRSLPKTATEMPLIGLLGVFAFSAGIMMRARRRF